MKREWKPYKVCCNNDSDSSALPVITELLRLQKLLTYAPNLFTCTAHLLCERGSIV